MVLGVFEWYLAQMTGKMQGKSAATQKRTIISWKKTFNKLALALKV